MGVAGRPRAVPFDGFSSALSAASIMFSLGHERAAARGARLLFHRARIAEPGEVSAESQTPEVLLRALGLYVDYAVADGERDALVALYRSVFDNGYVISGALARTLELLPRHRCRHLGGSTLDGARRSCL